MSNHLSTQIIEHKKNNMTYADGNADLGLVIDWFLVFNAIFSNISAISLRPVLVVEEAEVPGENHRAWASNW